MPVAEAQARITEVEFINWMLWFEWRSEVAERQRKGLPMHDGDAADEMTPEESMDHIRNIAAQLNARRT